jgi:DNA-binding winged helix-turn-helix (wHTH) protein
VWGRSSDVCKRTLEQHIYKLRRKLATGRRGAGFRIQAVYSVGYRLDLIAQPCEWSSRRTSLLDDSANAPLSAGTPTLAELLNGA